MILSKIQLCMLFIYLSTYCSGQDVKSTLAHIDTFAFKNVILTSKLSSFADKCIGEFCYSDTIEVSSVKSFNNALNKYLKTKIFSKMDAVVTCSVRLCTEHQRIVISEQHFKTIESAILAVKALEKTNKGSLNYSIVPKSCKWVRNGNIVYLLTYDPYLVTDGMANDIIKCINEHLEQ